MASINIFPSKEIQKACNKALEWAEKWVEGSTIFEIGAQEDRENRKKVLNLKNMIDYALKNELQISINQDDFSLIYPYLGES